jgi:glycosyltransferase involved in cell wall biosynthesis
MTDEAEPKAGGSAPAGRRTPAVGPRPPADEHPPQRSETQPVPPAPGPTYSLVVPFYNEVGNVDELYRRATAVMDSLAQPYEMLFVDDGSKDGTTALLARLAESDPRVTFIELRRNFGQTAALVAGFDHASGEVIIAMDGDLQHAPEDIPALLAPLADGYDLVSGWRKNRVDSFVVRRLPSAVANRLIGWLSGVPIHDFGTTFKVYRRGLLKHIRLYGEQHRFIPALAAAVGARIAEVPIQNTERVWGKSNYGLGRTVRVFMDLLTMKFLMSYFSRPLHFLGIPALITLILGAGIELFLFFEKLGKGWGQFHLMQSRGPLLVIGVFLMTVALLLLATGLLGELMVRVYHEARGSRPYYVRQIHRRGDRS